MTPKALLQLLPPGAARNAVDCALWAGAHYLLDDGS